MSISSTNSRNNYIGTGLLDTYAYTFKIFQAEDIKATIRDVAGVETPLGPSDITVTGVGDPAGGNVTLNAGVLATDYTLSLRRVRELVQPTDIRNQGVFLPEVHEDTFDELCMSDQQQQDEIDRSLKLAETIDPTTFDTEIPASFVGTPGASFITNPAGNGIIPGPTADAIAAAQAQAVAAAASAAAAAASAIDSEASAVDSAASAVSSASSAAAAAAAAASVVWQDIVYKTFADSPIAPTNADRGKLFVLDCTGGNIVFNLPSIASLDLSNPFTLGVKKSDGSANSVTVNRNGTDTIDEGTASIVFSVAGAGITINADNTPAPDDWESFRFGIFPPGSIGSTELAALSVINSKIGAGAVTYDKMADGAAFIEVDFGAFGPYGDAYGSYPQLNLDSFPIPYNMKVLNAVATWGVVGGAGPNTLDVKYSATPGGSYASIFTTPPSATTSASNGSFADSGALYTPGTGVTAPVLNGAVAGALVAGGVLRFDMTAGGAGWQNSKIRLFLGRR